MRAASSPAKRRRCTRFVMEPSAIRASSPTSCPPQYAVSTPLPAAPLPDTLTYRKAEERTGSYTDGARYTEFALSASTDSAVFANFRQIYYRRRYAGIENDGRMRWNSLEYADHVHHALGKVGRADLLERALPLISRLDTIGNGLTFQLTSSPHRVSGILMRYLGKVADVEQLFGTGADEHSLDGMHLVEIGVGYGGFAAVLLSIHPGIASYTLVDLPEVLNIAQRYLGEVKAAQKRPSRFPRLKFLSAAPCGVGKGGELATLFEPRKEGYDLAISMYAFAEVPQAVRQAYFEKIISRSARGYFSDHTQQKNTSALPTMLLSAAQAEPSSFKPNLSRLLVFRDFMSGRSAYERSEAQVGWGVERDYYPELLEQMRQSTRRPWTYHPSLRKLTLANHVPDALGGMERDGAGRS